MDNETRAKDRVCPQCKGTGRCKYCSGSGKHAYPGYGKPSDQPCMWCFGTIKSFLEGGKPVEL